ncbi:MAG: nucleotidyltransferase domain-containing protein, partial [Deefgea sp.]
MGTYTDALFTKSQQRVLAVLFGQPQRSFYANEIITLAGGGSGAVQRELAKLADAGLIKSLRIGNQKHYQANADSPIFAELRSIVVKTFGLTEVLRVALAELDAQIELALVYGSVAKGNEHAASDIDLMVVGELVSHSQLLAALLPAQQT